MAYANCATQSNAEVIELNATIAALEARVELLEQAAAAAPVEVSYTSLLALNTTTIPSSNPADPAFTDIYTNTSVELYERIRNIELDMVINPSIQVITQSPVSSIGLCHRNSSGGLTRRRRPCLLSKLGF